jgi:hypothetical protein
MDNVKSSIGVRMPSVLGSPLSIPDAQLSRTKSVAYRSIPPRVSRKSALRRSLFALRLSCIALFGRRRLLRLLIRDPLVRARFEQIEREGSAVENLVVEGANVKTCA